MKSIRETFLPDPGCVFVRVDMSQIEHRMCLMYTRSPRLVEIANLHPSEYDGHTDNAKMIFGKDVVTKDERYLGKTTTHAAERDMRGDTLSEHILKDTDGALFIPPQRCNRMIDKFFKGLPEIKHSYFPWVIERMIRDQVLINSWGRRWKCDKRRIDKDLYRQGFSFYLQSDGVDWVMQYLYLPTYYYMMTRYNKPPNLQCHDEVVVSVPPEDAYDAAAFMVAAAEQTRQIAGAMLKCPSEVIIGNSWGDQQGVEYKRLPSKDEVTEDARGVLCSQTGL